MERGYIRIYLSRYVVTLVGTSVKVSAQVPYNAGAVGSGSAPGAPWKAGKATHIQLIHLHISRSARTNTTWSFRQEIISTQEIFTMDQKSLLEVLTSVAKVPESGYDTYINDGYVLSSLQGNFSRVSLKLVHKASDPAACWRRCLWRFHYQPGSVGSPGYRGTRL